jgi:hypothetical protein
MASPETLVVDRLVSEAETEAERAIAVVRIAVAVILFLWIVVFFELYPSRYRPCSASRCGSRSAR